MIDGVDVLVTLVLVEDDRYDDDKDGVDGPRLITL